MKFKLIVAMIADENTEKVIATARELGATGATVITSARGEGLAPPKSFFGVTIEGQVDVALFIVEEHMSKTILEAISTVSNFKGSNGAGVALQLDIEDGVGLESQLSTIQEEIEEQI